MLIVVVLCIYIYVTLLGIHMLLSMYLCIYVSMYRCIYVSMYLSIYVCMYVCMYLCIYVCMYVCMYVCVYIYIHILRSIYKLWTCISTYPALQTAPDFMVMVASSAAEIAENGASASKPPGEAHQVCFKRMVAINLKDFPGQPIS